MTDLTVGDDAPAISLPRDGGETVTLSALSGPVVVYFYPRDDTPGCTKEAIGFTDQLEAFAYLGVERATFLINDGKIAQVWRKVKVPGHVDAVLEAVRAL